MRTWIVYIDETCIDGNHEFMAFGGVMLPLDLAELLDRGIADWRISCNMQDELKWTKVRRHTLERYVDFAGRAIRWTKHRRMFFKSMVVRRPDFDVGRFHDGSHDVAYSKLIYHLVLHSFVRAIPPGGRLLVILDNRPGKHSLHKFRRILNNGAKKKYGLSNPVQDVQFVDSKDSNIIQLSDVLLGAVGFDCNGKHTSTSALSPKSRLAREIADAVGMESFNCNTPKWMEGFSVWHLKLQC